MCWLCAVLQRQWRLSYVVLVLCLRVVAAQGGEGAERSGGAARQPLQLLSVAAPVPQWWEAEAAAETPRSGAEPAGHCRHGVCERPGGGGGGPGARAVAAVSPAGGWGGSGAGGSGSAQEGWLFKWTNYAKRYQRRWFVLSNGLLSYYRSKAEMRYSCRGTIHLATASIILVDSCNFSIYSLGAPTYHLKASSEVERQCWVTALDLAQAKAVRMLAESDESGDEESVSQTDKTELQNTLRTLSSKAEDLSTCNDLIAKHGTALQRSLSELGSLLTAESNEKIKQVNERATIFRITTNTMINACRDVLMFAQTHSKKWQKSLQYERDQRIRLDETLVPLAKQHNDLERAFREGTVLPAHPSGSAGPGEDQCCSGNRPTEQ